jgi:3-oxoacyl-[acyl-carrier protein] reductase
MEIGNSVAIVTGGTGGLGKCILRKLAQEGAHVAIVYQRSEQVARTFSAELAQMGIQSLPVQADVTKESDVQYMVEQVLKTFGRIDILVNDAGYNVWVDFTDLPGLTVDIWEKIMSINTTGPFLCMRAVGPIMKKQGRGRIVNIASIAGLEPSGSSIAYAVSKAGLIHLTRCMAVALAPEVLVNAVAPGFMEGTRASDQLASGHVEKAKMKSLTRAAVDKDEVAEQVLTFVRANGTTGQTLCMDGGRYFH